MKPRKERVMFLKKGQTCLDNYRKACFADYVLVDQGYSFDHTNEPMFKVLKDRSGIYGNGAYLTHDFVRDVFMIDKIRLVNGD